MTAPTTEDQVREARADMQERMDRLDRDFRELERQASSTGDPQRRADVERQVDQLRQQREELRTQADALSTASATTFSMERQGLMDRYNELDRALQQARLSAAATPRTYQRVSEEHLGRVDRDFEVMHERLDRLPETERARAAYDLIRLRQQRDQLANQTRRLDRIGDEEFDAARRQQTEALARLNDDLHSTVVRHDALVAEEPMRGVEGGWQIHGGGQVQDADRVLDRDRTQDGDPVQAPEPLRDQADTPPESLEMRPEDRADGDGR